jgi:hypothetical protein
MEIFRSQYYMTPRSADAASSSKSLYSVDELAASAQKRSKLRALFSFAKWHCRDGYLPDSRPRLASSVPFSVTGNENGRDLSANLDV